MAMDRETRINERLAAGRSRERRYRSLNAMHRLPATRDIDRCITAAVVRYLRDRDIQAPSDIMQPGVVVDVHAAAPVRLIVQELARANVDTGNKITRDRLWYRLRLLDRSEINRPL
jgi:hypothetical protein